MTELSPAAQAVFIAFGKYPLDPDNPSHGILYGALPAALRAAADQLGESRAPGAEFEDLYPRIIEVDELLAIADEIEALYAD